MAIGVYGQYLYIDPQKELVIVKLKLSTGGLARGGNVLWRDGIDHLSSPRYLWNSINFTASSPSPRREDSAGPARACA